MPVAANPVPITAGPQPVPAMPSSQPTDKYSAIADLESVFSSTSIGSGFSYPGSAGVNWAGGGGMVMGGPAMWRPQTAMYGSDGSATQGGHMYSSATNSTVAPPSYSTVAGNQLHFFDSLLDAST